MLLLPWLVLMLKILAVVNLNKPVCERLRNVRRLQYATAAHVKVLDAFDQH